jgi:hypothetical protein
MTMIPISRSLFAILFTAALLGGLAIIPYSMRLLASGQRKPLKFSLPTFLLLSFLQTAVLSAVAIGVGLLAAHAIGLGAPYIEAALAGKGSIETVAHMLTPAIGLGVLGGAVLLLLDLSFLRFWPRKIGLLRPDGQIVGKLLSFVLWRAE